MKQFFILLTLLSATINCSNNFLGQISNGILARKGQFPFIAKLVIKKDSGMITCGGSLISDRWILTAGHCTFGAFGGIAMMGRTRFDTEEFEMRTFDLSDMFTHRDYTAYPLKNDISAIRLSCPVNFSNLIQPIKLPQRAGNITYDGKRVTTAGWGTTNDTIKKVSKNLYFTKLAISPKSVCANFYKQVLTNGQICVQTENRKSTCVGDSGGPVILPDHRRTLIGIVSYGSSLGCEQNHPTVFTNVAFFLPWIRNVTGIGASWTENYHSVCPNPVIGRNITKDAIQYLDNLDE